MTLIVEDGSQVAGANSYVDDAAYAAYALARGWTIGADVAAREIELINSMDYIESHREQFKGERLTITQALQWPRSGVYIDGVLHDENTIPNELQNAQIEAAHESITASLLVNDSGQNIAKEKVDVIEVAYFSGGSSSTNASYGRVNAQLDVLLDDEFTSGAGGGSKRLIRI